MGRILSITITAILMMTAPVAAQLSADYAEYFEGPEGLLLTKEEAKEWETISNDAAAEDFIELFWAKRDHDLRTPVNEFRQEFNMRVEAADTNFAYGKTRGSMSDRGKILILLGRFSKRDVRAAGAAVGGNVGQTTALPGGTAGGGNAAAPGYYDEVGGTEIWEYDTATLPVKLKQEVIYAIFKESKIGFNDFNLDRALRENTYVQKLMKDIPEALIFHPKLTEIPRFGLLPDSEPATAEQIAWFEAGGPWPENARVVSEEGLVSGPRHFAWASVFLPSSVAAGDTIVGRLRSTESDEEIGTFALPVEPQASANGTRYELALPVGSGAWAVDLAVASGSEPLAVTAFEVETTPDTLEGTMISPIYWGTEVVQKPSAMLGEPFNVGGWHLVAPERVELTTSDTVNYMWYVINPVLDKGGKPNFEMRMSLYKDGKRVMRGSPKPAQHSEVGESLWMAGSGVPLEIFKEPGEFKLRVEVKQVSDSTTRVGEFTFVIAGPEEG